ncbi:MAG: hypothetical protein U5N86_05265 [Planctomycetota bacterium]|nr:hypothetical protein [Planctomycetota bacterium]
MAFGGDEITFLEAGDVLAHFHDMAAELVAKDYWGLDTRVGPGVPPRRCACLYHISLWLLP